MSHSYTGTETTSFTRTHARHIAAKVATDLKRMQRFYGEPSDERIEAYETEAIEFLKEGLLGTVTYGFRRNGDWIVPTLRYTARELAATYVDDDPGRIRPGADIRGASFGSYLIYNPNWDRLPSSEKEEFESRLPFRRTGAPEPGINGHWSGDRIYSAGGRALDRSSLRSYC